MTAKPLSDHRNAWDQIPWLINGTLDPDEAAATQAHVSTCPECMAELDRQQRISAVVAAFDAPVPSQAAALENISHRLTTQRSGGGVLEWITDFASRLASPASLAIGGAVAAALVVVVITVSLFEPGYETLTSSETVTEGLEIRLRFQAGEDPETIKDLMVTVGASNVTGPSETGLMRGVLTKDVAEDIIEQLRSDPRIVFVAKDQ